VIYVPASKWNAVTLRVRAYFNHFPKVVIFRLRNYFKMKTTCPICRKEAAWEGNRFRPFCSERCKLIDLGNWATESYRVPSKPDEDEENPSADPIKEDEEEGANGSSNGKRNGKPASP